MSAKIIKYISFYNFYNYYGDYEINTYKFDKGLNIIVADNGAGKSKFFNGFLWILKDIVYDSERKSADNIENVKFTIISDKAKKESSYNDKVRVGVKISYQDSKFEYVIEKYFYSTLIDDTDQLNKNFWDMGSIECEVSKRDLYLQRFHQVYDLEEQKMIIKNVILPDLQPYALLQGEEIDNIIDFSRKDSLNAAINKLTNIGRVKSLVKLSNYLLSRSEKDLVFQQKSHAKNINAFEEEVTKKEKYEELKKKKLKLIKTTRTTLNSAKEEKLRLLNSITNAEKRKEFRERINKLQDEKIILNKRYNKILNTINSNFFNESHPWLLMNMENEMRSFSNLYDEFIEKRAEKKIIKDESKKPFITVLPDGSPDYASLEKMLNQEVCFVCGREAKKGSEAWENIKRIKDRPTIFSKTSFKTKNNFKDFFGNIQLNTQMFYRNIPNIIESIKSIRKQLQDIDEVIRNVDIRIEQAEQELFQFGGSTNNFNEAVKDKNILEAYANANQRIGKCTEELKGYEKDIGDIEKIIEESKKNISDLAGVEVPQSYIDTTNILRDIYTIFENTKERIYEGMLKRLEDNANKHFQNLISGNKIDGGMLKIQKTSEETAIIKVVDNKGNQITGQSEGFQRMKKLAVVMAIISSQYSNRTFDYPLIADAPLSAFGKSFIEGFFIEVPKVFNQSIILVKELYDKERENHISELADRIMKTKDVGSLYLNEIEEDKSQVERITIIKKYK